MLKAPTISYNKCNCIKMMYINFVVGLTSLFVNRKNYLVILLVILYNVFLYKCFGLDITDILLNREAFSAQDSVAYYNRTILALTGVNFTWLLCPKTKIFTILIAICVFSCISFYSLGVAGIYGTCCVIEAILQILTGIHYLEIGTLLNLYAQPLVCALIASYVLYFKRNPLTVCNLIINAVAFCLVCCRYSAYSLYKAAQLNVEDIHALAHVLHISPELCNIVVFVLLFSLSILVSAVLAIVHKP